MILKVMYVNLAESNITYSNFIFKSMYLLYGCLNSTWILDINHSKRLSSYYETLLRKLFLQYSLSGTNKGKGKRKRKCKCKCKGKGKGKGKDKVVPVLLTEHHAMKSYWGSGVIAPPILNVGTRPRSVVSFTLYGYKLQAPRRTDWN
jgi:hypothetical protein